MPTPLNPHLAELTDYPFQRLTNLLGPVAGDATVMSIGEPAHPAPPLVAEIVQQNAHLWGKYPPTDGTAEFRDAVAHWLQVRFNLPAGLVEAKDGVLPVAGTREALYMIAATVLGPDKPLVLMPNPFYQVYSGAAVMAGATPYFVDAVNAPPDYSQLPPEVLNRVGLAYLCSPANPQGCVADLDLLCRMVSLARQYNFVLVADECYSEIWDKAAPPSALEACTRLGDGCANVLVFNSLSKRSSVPGLRSGFVAGDPVLIQAFKRVRSYGGAVTPLPLLAAASALWRDEEHVRDNQRLYRAKLDMAEEHLGFLDGFVRPPGGFFLWLNVGNGESVAKTLWEEEKIRVLPGAYLSRDGAGDAYIRVALVHDLGSTGRALQKIARVLRRL